MIILHLVRLLFELGDEERDQGHPLHNSDVRVSNVKKRCIIVVLQHVQGFFNSWPVGSEQLDEVGVQQIVDILAHSHVGSSLTSGVRIHGRACEIVFDERPVGEESPGCFWIQ